MTPMYAGRGLRNLIALAEDRDLPTQAGSRHPLSPAVGFTQEK